MNSSLFIKTEFGNIKIKASIDGRYGAEFDNPLPKRISDETDLHFHTLYELFFAEGGELIVKDRDGRHTFSDCIVSIPPFYEHTVISDPSRFRILFDLSEKSGKSEGDMYSKFAEIVNRGISPIKGNGRTKFCVDEIKRTIKRTDGLVREELSCLLKLLFLNLYRENTQERIGEGIGMENYLIVIDECINSHLEDDVTIAYVADKLHLSYRQTSRIIKANYKEPLHEIIIQKRLAKAKKLLETTELSVSEIALTVGFVNESYFYRLFSKKFGTTPKKFRISVLKNLTQN